ncbi:RTA1-domain-containing protein [Epithele typhae]|uniref:RTA1-domain-containing protein n=1 Tax=Epithele typhae TaxID=378194 RepID=UPI00200835FC|nr:RTA1-domain-containing protein [Epithele typhae]KAH9944344.1 RTA1-domain-containing protein [Epithele typhae]
MSSEDPIQHDSGGHIISPSYGYWPTQWVCYTFVVLFFVTTLLHLGQSIRYRMWWLLPTAMLAGIGEAIGWAGRLWSSYDPLNGNGFLIQIVCTIIAATPLVGALFITFGRVVVCLGDQYSRLPSALYSKVFFTIDFVALLVQSTGGGIAATAGPDHASSQLGSNIMLAGIVFQLASLTVFCALVIEYVWRYYEGRPLRPSLVRMSSGASGGTSSNKPRIIKPLKMLLVGLSAETTFLYIRAVYRTIELADGFTGKIIRTEVWFNVFDAAMVVLAMYTLNACHPGRLLGKAAKVHEAAMPLVTKNSRRVNTVV